MTDNIDATGEHSSRTDIEDAAGRRIRRRVTGSGVLELPGVPSLLKTNHEKVLAVFAVLERRFNGADAANLLKLLSDATTKAWQESPYAKLIVKYHTETGDGGVTYQVNTSTTTVAQSYDQWVTDRPKPYFGAHPNAKVLDLARSCGAPPKVPVLDIGAGEGRNALPLARLGFPVDCVELSQGFAGELRANLERENFTGRVFVGDISDHALGVPPQYYRLVFFAGVLVAHVRNVEHLASLLKAAVHALAPEGHLLFSIFRINPGVQFSERLRELGEVFWTVAFTQEELDSVAREAGITLVHDEPYVDYEREHLPESWPPTDYFEAYAFGQDLFDLSSVKVPMSMRWLTYRKTR